MIHSYNMDLIAQVYKTVLHLEEKNPKSQIKERTYTLRGTTQTSFGQDQELLLPITNILTEFKSVYIYIYWVFELLWC